jgi:hypothetical protein
MAERLNHVESGAEKGQKIEVHVGKIEHLSNVEKAEAGEKQQHQMEQARESVEKLAMKASEQASKKEGHKDSEEPEIVLNHSYRSVMHRVERQLPTYQRAFSKFIRNPSVDKASIIVGDTIARPSGIIGGAGLAFFGLLIFGYTAKSVGFELPNSLFVLLVIVGWIGGLLFDFLFSTFKRLKR